MSKKLFGVIIVSIFFICSSLNSFALTEEFKPFEPKQLDYPYGYLEPFIDKETMVIHHTKHYKAYLDKLNKAVEKHPELYNCSVYDLITNLDSLPKDVATVIKNNGGGVYNHEFFFDIMTPKDTKLSENLETAINRDFGSFEEFKDEFKDAALSVFGSGWAWLVSDDNGKLSIITTSNQDTPVTLNLKPIIGIDVWEHAYYLLYQNNRGNYIDCWFNVVNWEKALKHYMSPIDKLI